MPFKFGVDSSGNYGYIKDGADTVIPFKGDLLMDIILIKEEITGGFTSVNQTLEKDYKYIVCYMNQTSSATHGKMYTTTPSREKKIAKGVDYNGNASASIEVFVECKQGDVIKSANGQWFCAVIVGFYS